MESLPIDALWFRLLAGLLIGLVMGSFTTMLSYRVPRGISIVNPPSHCPKCKTPLTPLDLVPVLSWLASKGKCAHCEAPISPRYMFIELATTFGVMFAFYQIGFHPSLIPAILAIVALVSIVTINIERSKRG